MLHKMRLQSEPFQQIQSGQKRIELRLNDEKRQKILAGDQIEFTNLADTHEKIRVLVLALHHAADFAELFSQLPPGMLGCPEGTVPDSRQMEQYYSPEEQSAWGALGIELRLLPPQYAKQQKVSRYLSYLLRHRPDAAGLTLDEHGWADVDALLESVGKSHGLTRDMLEEIVAEDEKQRYAFSEDHRRIRANQGHSIQVDVELEQQVPPPVLWHGTGTQSVAGIKEKGLLPRSRLYVHLSPDLQTARAVARRHGETAVFAVDAARMHRDGCVFYRSVNNVWLTDCVAPSYLTRIQ